MATIRGELGELIRSVRRLVGSWQPGSWDDSDIVDAANSVMSIMFMDILLPANTGYGVYPWTLSLVADTEYYDLPYGFLRLLAADRLNDDGTFLYQISTIMRPERPDREGVWVEGNQLGVSPIPAASVANAIKILHSRVPVPAHAGIAQAVADTSITLAKVSTYGTISTRSGAYIGARVQITDATTGEGTIATIRAYDGPTRVATVSWTKPTGTNIQYEILPDVPDEARDYWYLATAWNCLSGKEAGTRAQLERLNADLTRARRALAFTAATRQKRRIVTDSALDDSTW